MESWLGWLASADHLHCGEGSFLLYLLLLDKNRQNILHHIQFWKEGIADAEKAQAEEAETTDFNFGHNNAADSGYWYGRVVDNSALG